MTNTLSSRSLPSDSVPNHARPSSSPPPGQASAGDPATASSPLARALAVLSSWSARHFWLVVAAWLLILGVLGALAGTAGGAFRNDMAAPDSPSTWATVQLREHVPGAGDATGRIVARTDSVAAEEAATRALDEARTLPDVRTVHLRTNADGAVTVIDVTYDRPLTDLSAGSATADLKEAAQPFEQAGVTWGVGGELPESVQGPNGVAEAVGMGVALIILLLVLRSWRLALLPLLTAAVGVGAGIALIMVLAGLVDLSTVTPTLASMVGIGLAIDYSLLYITRYRKGFGAGLTSSQAAAQAGATAGHAVLLAGLIVVIGLSGLAWSGVPGFAWMGVGAALVVVTSVAASLTLVPAVLARMGSRVRPLAPRPELAARSFTDRLCARVVARPVSAIMMGVAALALIALPAAGVRLAQNDAGAEAAGNPTRIAYDLMAEGFGPGANGPFVVVAETEPSGSGSAETDALAATLARDPAVASSTPPVTSPDGAVTTWTLFPEWGPQDERTQDFATRLRADLPEGTAATGPTAAMLDLTNTLSGNLWRSCSASCFRRA